jgi:hypothetical protein
MNNRKMNNRKRELKSSLTLCLGLMICFCFGQNSNAQTFEGFVVEGKSFDGIIIGKTVADDVVSAYGNEYRSIKHKEYSYEMFYQNLGLAFYYCQNDPNKEIMSVRIQAPYTVTTSRGIILGKSTIGDVFRLYGGASETSAGFIYEGILFLTRENEPPDPAETDPEPVKSGSSAAEIKASENNSVSFLSLISADDTKSNFVIEGADISDHQITKSAPVDPEKEEREMKELKAMIVKQIVLVEKPEFRQCHTKFPKNGRN